MIDDVSTLKVIVAQMGARHNYALPRMLYNQNALYRFYTDSCIKGGTRTVVEAWPQSVSSSTIGKLRRRIVKGVPSSLIYSYPIVNIKSALAYSKSTYGRYQLENELFAQQMIKRGLGDANVLYGVFGSGVPFWRYAKEHGIKVATDIFITPLYHRIVAKEKERYPDWEDSAETNSLDYEFIDGLMHEMIEVADLLLCPSQNVLDDIKVFSKDSASLVDVLPTADIVSYGIRVDRLEKSEPVQGRILYAGGADLRKGIHYLADAATTLKAVNNSLDIRVAGKVTDQVRNHPKAKNLNFLGHLSKEQLQEEYYKADVFVLPTLAEGSATVVHEALAAGLPVVTTVSAGSVVSHGKEGLIVPERDSFALADALEMIVGDRVLRKTMSEQAVQTSEGFDEGPWSRRLIEVLGKLHA